MVPVERTTGKEADKPVNQAEASITTGSFSREQARSRTVDRAWVAIAASVPALLYLLFVFHYSVNVPWGFDDWAIVSLVAAANHGHLTMGTLWLQYGDRRLVISRLITVAFGVYDSLNERTVMMFTAALFVASYVVFLASFRDYLRKRLTWLAVLVVGVVWFSLTDWFAALWSFQLLWYLVVVFFVAMVALLQRKGPVLFALAVASAVLASLSDISGFVLWPVGLICILMAPATARGGGMARRSRGHRGCLFPRLQLQL